MCPPITRLNPFSSSS